MLCKIFGVFNDTCWPSWLVVNKIKTKLDITLKSYGSVLHRAAPREVGWYPPSNDTIKVNVDGSSLGNPGRAGYGRLLKNRLGEWICGFSGSCGFADNLTAEVYAIIHGLDLAWNHGYRDIILESDSKSAIDLLYTVQQYHPIFPLMDHIHGVLARQWKVEIQHTLREGNECADWMAKLGATSDTSFAIWDNCPHPLSTILLADALGVLRLRL